MGTLIEDAFTQIGRLFLDNMELHVIVDNMGLEVGDYHPTMGTRRWDDRTNRWETRHGLYPEVNTLALALSKAVTSGAADHILRAAFGDHAVITVTAGGIDVAWYDHE